ncbi:MAG TPA: uroporphyrinogen decarboxylase family protein [Candidatus Acidoferrum sp.]|nr:uroporphyrinogen decarboxylase family protein [Candidatus Acidoferrum sp.]
MSGGLHPREMIKGLLQGIAPTRPLFLPIVFSLGAKVENLSLQSYLANPTKISNALRQIRGYLRADGVCCYFDPYLELDALGANLQWGAAGEAPQISWQGGSKRGELPGGLRSVEDAAKAPRVTVAVEVIRRLKTILRNEPLLMAGVTGPLTLASQLTGCRGESESAVGDLNSDAIELSAAILGSFARTFAEAGTNVVFIQEEVAPAASDESYEHWASLLEPVFNVVRFYEALPVLLLTESFVSGANLALMFRRNWNCVVCLPVKEYVAAIAGGARTNSAVGMGIALPSGQFSGQALTALDAFGSVGEAVKALRPAIVTTTGDVPLSSDPKLIMQAFHEIVPH